MKYKLLYNKKNLYLITVLEYLIQHTGRECEIVDTVDEKDNTQPNTIYILSFFHAEKNIPKHYIVYQVEQMHFAKFTQYGAYKTIIENAKQCWDYNTINQELYTNTEKIWMPIPLVHLPNPFEIHPFPNKDPNRIDVFFFGSINIRRFNIMKYLYDTLTRYGVQVRFVHNVVNNSLYKCIQRSKIVLNLGFYKNTALATYRLNEVLMHEKYIISESTTLKQDFDVIQEYKKAGVYFIPRIHDDLSNIRYLLDVLNKLLSMSDMNYNQYVQKNRLFRERKQNFFLHHIHQSLHKLEQPNDQTNHS